VENPEPFDVQQAQHPVPMVAPLLSIPVKSAVALVGFEQALQICGVHDVQADCNICHSYGREYEKDQRRSSSRHVPG
jgi:hypothetical protein